MTDSAAWVNPLRNASDKRLPRIAGPAGMVIFGVTGDLAYKKLLPAISDLASRGLLPAGFTLVGYGRRDWDKVAFCDYVRSAVVAGSRTEFNEDVWQHLSQGIEFVQGSFDDAGFDRLSARLGELDRERGTGSILPFRSTGVFLQYLPPAGAGGHGQLRCRLMAPRHH